jgi:NitT/TauT family transport system permease protein
MSTRSVPAEAGEIIAPPSSTGEGIAGMRPVVLPIGLALAVLVGWQAYVTLANVPSVVLPSPVAIIEYIFDHYDVLLTQAVPTTVESAVSFIVATVVGVILAIAITYSDTAREALYPNLVFFQLIPKIALAPLFIIWLGIGSQSRIAFSVFIAFSRWSSQRPRVS